MTASSFAAASRSRRTRPRVCVLSTLQCLRHVARMTSPSSIFAHMASYYIVTKELTVFTRGSQDTTSRAPATPSRTVRSATLKPDQTLIRTPPPAHLAVCQQFRP